MKMREAVFGAEQTASVSGPPSVSRHLRLGGGIGPHALASRCHGSAVRGERVDLLHSLGYV